MQDTARATEGWSADALNALRAKLHVAARALAGVAPRERGEAARTVSAGLRACVCVWGGGGGERAGSAGSARGVRGAGRGRGLWRRRRRVEVERARVW